LVSGGADRQVYVWDLNKLRVMYRLPDLHEASIASICIDSTSGDIVTASGYDLFVWTINGTLLAHRRMGSGSGQVKPGDAITSLTIAKETNGAIITGHRDGSIRFFSIEV
jgi:WD40 repeat protein